MLNPIPTGHTYVMPFKKKVEVEKEDLTAVVKAVRNAMDEVVPGPMQVMSGSNRK